MTKFADVKLDTTTWTKLTDIDGCDAITVGNKIELYNAGTGEILYCEENSSDPTDATFAKTLKPHHVARFVYCANFYVKSACGTAKMIVSDYA